MANYELGGAYYADEIAKQNNLMGQNPLQQQTQSPLQEPFDFNALNTSIGNLQTGIDSILTKFDDFKPGKTLQPGPGGPPKKISGPGIIEPNFSPYERNENLDLTDRSGIMSEYSNYLQGGHGYRGPTPGISRMAEFMGEEMSIGYGNSFGKFLDTFGIRDRLQFPAHELVSNQSPLQQTAAIGTGFRPEGDMGKYVAFNDPGQPGAGYSNYQDYLNAAGNEPVTPGAQTNVLPQSGYQV